jgi:hypothetical protein
VGLLLEIVRGDLIAPGVDLDFPWEGLIVIPKVLLLVAVDMLGAG